MSDDPEIALLQWQARSNKLQYIEQCQFYLSYLSYIGIDITDNMSVAEFNNIYHILLSQKKHEEEERQKALAASKKKKR